ncbi:MAG: radical SAM family heme chaperone HemW [Acidobacteria bacterium]|nr:radical SAM family heme chaperone HemW [Acidobacteriota bacterium]
MSLAGVYIHIPFCKSRCSYCDFATDVWRSDAGVERYVRALCLEIESFRPIHGKAPFRYGSDLVPTIDTVYFGGGTPSLLSPKQLETVLTSVRSKFSVEPSAEITMEMNPATVTPESLAAFRSLGVNRASFGVQTFDDRALKLLARGHDANDARATFAMLRDAGFENVSFDLIAGLPGQTLQDWEQNLDKAIDLSPEHMSLYLLEIHEGTPLAEQVRSKRQPQPDPEVAAEMYEMMLDRLAAAGYEQYEISNFSRPGFGSRHNSKYWMLDPVFGFGVSAHSFDGRQRYANERDTAKYVSMAENSGSAEVFREDIDLASESAFLGLRLERGVDLGEFSQRFGIDLSDKYRTEIKQLSDDGLVEVGKTKIKLTRKGKLYSNEVFSVFV